MVAPTIDFWLLAEAAQDVAHLVQLDLGLDALDELVDLLVGQESWAGDPYECLGAALDWLRAAVGVTRPL